jgi:hypothetical protein
MQLDALRGDPRLAADVDDNAVKGATILTRRQCAQDLFGAGAVDKVAAALPERSRDAWTKPRFAAAWVPMPQLVDIDAAIIGELLGGDPARLREVAQHSAKLELNALYRFLLKLGSPGFVVKRLSVAFSTKVRRGRVVDEALVDKGARMVLHDAALPRYYCEHAVPSWGVAAVELTGATGVVSTKEKCRHRGDDVCAWTIRWT